MRLSELLFTLFRFFTPPAIIGTVYLYFYPALSGCAFPEAKSAQPACFIPGQQRPAVPAEIAPFRLLALADPQLEGDTSLPSSHRGAFSSLGQALRDVEEGGFGSLPLAVGQGLKGLVTEDIPGILQGYRKRLDLWGNDLYLAHIYWLVSWWTAPTHTVVLGDLLGSQWIGDDEFLKRSNRFWRKVFKGAEKVPRDVSDVTGRTEPLEQDAVWNKRVIAVAGNHDIGYAGDIDEHRLSRFEEMYGSVNWDIRFQLGEGKPSHASSMPQSFSVFEPTEPELQLIILNSMNLDDPAWKPQLQEQSRDFIAKKLFDPTTLAQSKAATILLTHIPLHKEAGVCIDAPFFDYFPPEQGGGIREQNHLSEHWSSFILGGLIGDSSRQAIVLNGHDHEGCDTYHYSDLTSSEAERLGFNSSPDGVETSPWHAQPYDSAEPQRANGSLVGLREITVRSMMGFFGGNAGLLSAWFDRDDEQWKFEYSTCVLGVQHIWWGVHVFDLIVIGMGLVSLVLEIWDVLAENAAYEREKRVKKMKKA